MTEIYNPIKTDYIKIEDKWYLKINHATNKDSKFEFIDQTNRLIDPKDTIVKDDHFLFQFDQNEIRVVLFADTIIIKKEGCHG